ncbi:MAG: hypothetical protein LQ340_002179 [Diploschistes diacapsis]|nr:MAG: hypothetical protein LQ340_002179 [Diploschistes diacapsis]
MEVMRSSDRAFVLDKAKPACSESLADALLRIAAYCRKDLDRAAIWFPPDEHTGIPSSMSRSFPREPHPGLDFLGVLPLELLHYILLYLDLLSLFRFRQTSLLARQAVSSLPYYQLLASHGLPCFRALLLTRLAGHISLPAFYRLFCSWECSRCRNFGFYAFLPTWTRVCYACITSGPEFIVRTPSIARKQLRMYIGTSDDEHSSGRQGGRDKTKKSEKERGRRASEDTLSRPGVRQHFFRIIPGTYGAGEFKQHVRPEGAAVADRHVLGAGWHALGYPIADDGRKRALTFAACCALPLYDPQTRTVDSGVSCAGCRLKLQRAVRETKEYFWAAEDVEVVHLRKYFSSHAESCQHAQRLWKASQEGAVEPLELAELRRSGELVGEEE